MINATIAVLLNIVLNFILSRYLGIGGLALATSIACIFSTLLLIISLRKKIGSFGMKNIMTSYLRILFASLVMGGASRFIFNNLLEHLSQNIALITSIGAGAIVYFVIIYFMRIDDVDVIVRALKGKFTKDKAKS